MKAGALSRSEIVSKRPRRIVILVQLFRVENILLHDPGNVAEAGKRIAPTAFLCDHPPDPGVDRRSGDPAVCKETHAIGDLNSHAVDFHESGNQFVVLVFFKRRQVQRAAVDSCDRILHIRQTDKPFEPNQVSSSGVGKAWIVSNGVRIS